MSRTGRFRLTTRLKMEVVFQAFNAISEAGVITAILDFFQKLAQNSQLITRQERLVVGYQDITTRGVNWDTLGNELNQKWKNCFAPFMSEFNKPPKKLARQQFTEQEIEFMKLISVEPKMLVRIFGLNNMSAPKLMELTVLLFGDQDISNEYFKLMLKSIHIGAYQLLKRWKALKYYKTEYAFSPEQRDVVIERFKQYLAE